MSQQKAVYLARYSSPGEAPVLAVTTESEIEGSIKDLLDEVKYTDSDGFVAHQVFDVDTSMSENHLEATKKARSKRKENSETEYNQSLLYYWNVKNFPVVNRGGVISGTRPAPLSVGEITDVLRQLHSRKDYSEYTIIVISEDHKVVRLDKTGGVSVEDIDK